MPLTLLTVIFTALSSSSSFSNHLETLRLFTDQLSWNAHCENKTPPRFLSCNFWLFGNMKLWREKWNRDRRSLQYQISQLEKLKQEHSWKQTKLFCYFLQQSKKCVNTNLFFWLRRDFLQKREKRNIRWNLSWQEIYLWFGTPETTPGKSLLEYIYGNKC